MFRFRKNFPIYTVFLTIVVIVSAPACRRSGGGGIDILGPPDETDEAVKLVASANEDLTKIKVLYDENENKREELKKAMAANGGKFAQPMSIVGSRRCPSAGFLRRYVVARGVRWTVLWLTN